MASCSRASASPFDPRFARGWLPSSPARVALTSTRAPSPTPTRTFSAKASSPAKASTKSLTLHAVLNRRFPRNALLSHDLIEGAYARAGLVTDIELIDDYPSHYSAYSRRNIAGCAATGRSRSGFSPECPTSRATGGPTRSPRFRAGRSSTICAARWSNHALLILFVAGWLRLPGGPLYWTIVGLLLLCFPMILQLGFSLGRAIAGGNRGQCLRPFPPSGARPSIRFSILFFFLIKPSSRSMPSCAL